MPSTIDKLLGDLTDFKQSHPPWNRALDKLRTEIDALKAGTPGTITTIEDLPPEVQVLILGIVERVNTIKRAGGTDAVYCAGCDEYLGRLSENRYCLNPDCPIKKWLKFTCYSRKSGYRYIKMKLTGSIT